MDFYINITLMTVVSFFTVLVLHQEKYSTVSILNSIIIGLVCVIAGSISVYLFADTERVFNVLSLKKVQISGKFVIVGYGCIIGSFFGAIIKTFRVLICRTT